MIEVPLSRGQVAIVDDEDRWFLSRGWHAHPDRGTFYARTTVSRRTLLMHTEILRTAGLLVPGTLTDHADGNGLHNCRSNLRSASRTQNKANSVKRSGKSPFKGVQYSLASQPWMARIRCEGKMLYLGRHDTAEAAARAYDAKALELFGEFACLNFPKE